MAAANESDESGTLVRWQALLDRQAPYLGPIRRGRIGLVDWATFPPGTMLLMEITDGRAQVRVERFPGLEDCGCDLLLVGADSAGGLRPDQPDALAALGRLIRRGEVLLYMPGRDLLSRGFADLIDALGVPFRGTCH